MSIEQHATPPLKGNPSSRSREYILTYECQIVVHAIDGGSNVIVHSLLVENVAVEVWIVLDMDFIFGGKRLPMSE